MYNPDVISAKGQHQIDRKEARITYATLVMALLSGILIWWAIGFAFAFGAQGSADWFIGLAGFFL